MKNFDDFFDNSQLPRILKKAKTVSKEEVRGIFEYFQENRPKVLLEFGVQYGCSTRVFYDIAKYLEIDLEIHSWDIEDKVKFMDKKDFTLHVEDVTGKEEGLFEKYNPDLLFLDAHPYILTRNLVKLALENEVNFMTHDISMNVYEALKRASNNFQNKKVYAAWELYVLEEIFGSEVVTEDVYEDDDVRIEFIRDKFGLCILYNK